MGKKFASPIKYLNFALPSDTYEKFKDKAYSEGFTIYLAMVELVHRYIDDEDLEVKK